MKRIGITGSRKGLSDRQKVEFVKLLSEYSQVEIHHGDCFGVDSEIHTLLFESKWDTPKEIRIFLHPPTDPKQRSFNADKFSGKDILVHSYSTQEFLDRNKKIVESTDELWAFPDGPEKTRSGTWSTIRYARKISRPVRIFWKDGSKDTVPDHTVETSIQR